MSVALRSSWQRQGQILAPVDLQGIRLIQTPTAWLLPNGLLRLAMACRNGANVSVMFIMDCDPAQGMKIVRPPKEDDAALHALASGDLSGLGPCDALWDGGELVLVTSSLRRKGRIYDAAIEVMTSTDSGATFTKPRTILTSASNGGYPVTLPCIRKLQDGRWRMWFTAFTQWFLEVQPHPDARYCIRSASSSDGLTWTVDPDPALLWTSGEAGLARPSVQETGGQFEMWFSARGPYVEDNPELRRYRLCYARSADGFVWQRHDDQQAFSNPPVAGDWDDQMQCYPFVLPLADGRQLMFYCGNGYGQSGIGWAVRGEPLH
ncbi:glycoside hydrolase family protein [Affinirhizobium pseudoryzae]|uniref:hypothetical protein n=1 Tax=Allorhizobium pseudoryzae TaxID=379684 RepID=UPI001F26C796|nr:hypothetical protein [Allorhizobium pseudoryzae]